MVMQKFYGSFLLDALTCHAQLSFKKWNKCGGEMRRPMLLKDFEPLKAVRLTSLYQEHYLAILQTIIEKRVLKSCKGEFQSEVLHDLKKWLSDDLIPFALTIFDENGDQSSTDPVMGEHAVLSAENTSALSARLERVLLRALCEARAKELFEMVGEFPESLVAIKEVGKYHGAVNSPESRMIAPVIQRLRAFSTDFFMPSMHILISLVSANRH
jgi:hypothetical protein